MAQETAIANHAGEIETLMLHCRRTEKDFLLRQAKKYLDQLKANIASLKEQVQAVRDLAQQGVIPRWRVKPAK